MLKTFKSPRADPAYTVDYNWENVEVDMGGIERYTVKKAQNQAKTKYHKIKNINLVCKSSS